MQMKFNSPLNVELFYLVLPTKDFTNKKLFKVIKMNMNVTRYKTEEEVPECSIKRYIEYCLEKQEFIL